MVKNIFKLIGIFIIACITFINIYNYYNNKKDNIVLENIIQSIDNKVGYNYIKYKGIIEIPSINLKKGFYNIGDIENNVDLNVEVLYNTLPNGILALASHSGNGNNAYFKYLYKVKLNDIVYIYYNEIKYKYKVIKIYEEVRDGNIDISYSNKLLLLTTCKGNNQLIVIAKML